VRYRFLQPAKRRFPILPLLLLVVALLGAAGYILWPKGGDRPSSGSRAEVASGLLLPAAGKGSARTAQQEGDTLAGDSNLGVASSSGHDHVAVIGHGPASGRMVALTFDDGPSTYTTRIMHVLEQNKAPATFFCIGRQAAKLPGTVAQLKAAGFEVENHTWDHPVLTHLGPQAILSEIARTNQVLGGAKYLRPPYGSVNAAVGQEAGLLGMKIVLWDVDTLDWKYRNAGSILRYLKADVKPGSIILMHDGGGNRSQTVAALPAVIAWLRSQGYSLVSVNRLVQAQLAGTSQL